MRSQLQDIEQFEETELRETHTHPGQYFPPKLSCFTLFAISAQAQAIPVIMSGRDMIGIAKTGSGKTLAFLLPMFRHIADQEPLEEGDGPIAVIMTPTRELCLQIGKECRKFTKAIDARAVCVYGGTGISEQIAELKRGAEIIVCTPGSRSSFYHETNKLHSYCNKERKRRKIYFH